MQASPTSVASTSLEPPETNRIRELPPRDARSFSRHPAEVFRHTGWWRNRELVREALVRTGQTCDRVWNFGQCGVHSYVVRSPDNPDVFRITGSTCHDRFCMPCANSRSSTIAMNTLEHLADRESRFITLTLHSTNETLAELLAKISADFATLRTRSLWKKSVFGGVAFIEVKWVADLDRWNVHLHCLAVGRYIRQGKLTHEWFRITGTSKIVHVCFVKNSEHVSRYVTKYASKPLHHSVLHDPDRLDEAIVAFKGKRLCTTFGNWRGVCLTDSPSEEAWEYVDTLCNLIDNAKQGDAESIRICNLLGMPDVIVFPKARPPPISREIPDLAGSFGLQTNFPFTETCPPLQWA